MPIDKFVLIPTQNIVSARNPHEDEDVDLCIERPWPFILDVYGMGIFDTCTRIRNNVKSLLLIYTCLHQPINTAINQKLP